MVGCTVPRKVVLALKAWSFLRIAVLGVHRKTEETKSPTSHRTVTWRRSEVGTFVLLFSQTSLFWTIYLLPFLGKIFHSEKVLWKSLQRQAKRCASKGSLSAVRLIDSQPQQQSQLDLMFMNASSILWLQLRTTSRSASTKESMLDMALGIIPSLIDKANIICTCPTGLLWGMGKASVLLYKETVSIEANVVRAVQC